jgi:hypothetical protein
MSCGTPHAYMQQHGSQQLPLKRAVAAAAAVAATQASVPDSAAAAGAAQLLSGLGNLSLSDQASIASAAGAAGALQAAGNLANGSEADVQANVSVRASTTGVDSVLHCRRSARHYCLDDIAILGNCRGHLKHLKQS